MIKSNAKRENTLRGFDRTMNNNNKHNSPKDSWKKEFQLFSDLFTGSAFVLK